MAEELELAEPTGSNKKIIIILIAIIAVLLLGGGGAVLYLSGVLSSDAPVTKEAGTPKEEPRKAAIYVDLGPAFTVNLNAGSKAKYLQVALEAMVREADVDEQLRKHLPVIRSDLNLLFGGKTSQELATREGKEALQAEALKSIQKVLKGETGKEGVENVFFTTFVMQ